jgi:predicted phosphate transport protein (TIGR00153 family)
MKFLLPKEPAFAQHFSDLSACLSEITAVFQDFSRNFNHSAQYWEKAKLVEHKADQVAHEIIRLLNQCFITPFDREDIYKLVHEIDDIIDLIENAIHNVYLYNLTEKRSFIDEFAAFSREATEKLNLLVAEIFKSQKYTPHIAELIRSIHDLEDKGDMVYARSLQKLFQEEKDPVNIMKWKDVLFILETIMDVYQRVSNTVEGIVVKSS